LRVVFEGHKELQEEDFCFLEAGRQSSDKNIEERKPRNWMKDFNELLERQRCPGFLPPPSYRGRGSLLSDEMWDFSCGFTQEMR
jgi:hypothetical protein